MTGVFSYICELCETHWDCATNEIDLVYVASFCDCEITRSEFQKGLDMFGLTAVYAGRQ